MGSDIHKFVLLFTVMPTKLRTTMSDCRCVYIRTIYHLLLVESHPDIDFSLPRALDTYRSFLTRVEL